MRILVTKYKNTGKFYDSFVVDCVNSTYFDNSALKGVIIKCNNWDGYATVTEIQPDGFELPMRLLTPQELKG